METIKLFCKNPTKELYQELSTNVQEMVIKFAQMCIDEKRGRIYTARKILNIHKLQIGIPQCHYFKDVLTNPREVFDYFSNQTLYNSDEDSRVQIFGKWIPIPRKQMAYGDEGMTYTFSGVTVPAKPWFPLLLGVKKQIEKLLGTTCNFVLINYYHDGSKGINYHADDEKDLINDSVIASLSLGATRNFYFKDKRSKKVFKMRLFDNSVVTMEDKCQKRFKHSIPKQSINVVKSARVNMTFRQMRV